MTGNVYSIDNLGGEVGVRIGDGGIGQMVVTNVINDLFESVAKGRVLAEYHAADSMHVFDHMHCFVWRVWAFLFGLCGFLCLNVGQRGTGLVLEAGGEGFFRVKVGLVVAGHPGHEKSCEVGGDIFSVPSEPSCVQGG